MAATTGEMCPGLQFSLGSGQGGVQNGQFPPQARAQLYQGSFKGRGVWGSWQKHTNTQWNLTRVSLRLLVACCPLGLALTTHFPFFC